MKSVGPGLKTRSRPAGPLSTQPRNEYRRRLPHYKKDFQPVFVTFTTLRRWKLPPAARDIVFNCCIRENGQKLSLHAAVVMPDHAHLIYTPLKRPDGWDYTLPEIMKAIKGRSARYINLALKRTGPVWHEEFFDHVLRSNDSLMDRVEYVCLNPVRAGLARTESEHKWVWKGQIPVL